MDFFKIRTKETRKTVEVYPDFVVGRSKDLMVRGQAFYAIWDEDNQTWSTDEYDVVRIVDQAVRKHVEKLEEAGGEFPVVPKYLESFDSNRWTQFKKLLKSIGDNSHQLDMSLTFANTETKKSDYSSRRLPYSLVAGDYSAWDELVGTLYSEKERAKIEWFIGAVISGDAKKIEKFLVFYGPGGTGKSTVMKIIQKLFPGYTAMFEAKALVGNNNAFAAAMFKNNPLVAIQHDGDLSKIEDNSVLNSVVGHDTMLINEKYKSGYEMDISAALFMGTNKPVKITDAKSGLIRRLIDVGPTGMKFEPDHYHALMGRIDFELGAIAYHCLQTYRSMGKNYYNNYKPLEMMYKTDMFFNFVEEHSDVFKGQEGVTLKQAWAMYKEYCTEAALEYKVPMYKFREALKDYFDKFEERALVDGVWVRSYFSEFNTKRLETRFDEPPMIEKPKQSAMLLEETVSLLDRMLVGQPAQYANDEGNPRLYWTNEERLINGEMQKPKASQVVSTTLEDVDTSKLHFVKVPANHIVIDFDLTGDDGEKSLERNLEAASKWPDTYTELSKSGKGVHLHYIYEGDVTLLKANYDEGIEVKVYPGNSSLRRRLSFCNNLPVATINSGLPLKEKKTVLEKKTVQTERSLRSMIDKALEKQYDGIIGTKSNIDFIKHLLDEAYKNGVVYDVTDLRNKILVFANGSTNQALNCLRTVQQMKWKSEDEVIEAAVIQPSDGGPIIIYDVEVYPNLFVVCWMAEGDEDVTRMINPTAAEIERLTQFKLVGFHNRGYDNHILYGRMMGYDNERLYRLSQKIINNEPGATFGDAYSLSYADIYDFAAVKQSLKKWQIDLGISHVEMDIPWDQPVPEERIPDVVEYCVNDVKATAAVFEARKQDFIARKILADLSGLTVNDTTRRHAGKIIFGNDRAPQGEFVYTDLSKDFPGYTFDEYAKVDKSHYRGESVGEGGYVYAEPGVYENVVLLDVASMHPTSIEELKLFGPYTAKFSALKEARLSIKDGDFGYAKKLLEGKLAPHIESVEQSNMSEDQKSLAYWTLEQALKLVINSIYGYTSATFPNLFRDPRNKDNIVAKRGALFMIDLMKAVQEKGFIVAHIKTDSIKIPDANEHIIEFVKEFGAKYGYTFNHEATYKKMCLVNDAVYIARVGWTEKKGNVDYWSATGAQFAEPYVFKTLFSNDKVTFSDLCVAKAVANGAAIYIDPHNGEAETPANPLEGMRFVGRIGRFMPITKESGGGKLMRVKDEKIHFVGGTKSYHWAEAEVVKGACGFAEEDIFEDGWLPDCQYQIDMQYFNDLAHDAIAAIEEYGSFEEFVK